MTTATRRRLPDSIVDRWVRPAWVERALPLAIPPALVAFLSWSPATQGPTTCPFALVTGHACPLCGGTRAAAALMRGDPAAAWSLHPLIFVVAPLLIAGYVRWWGVREGRLRPLPSGTVNRIVAILIGLFVTVWLVRAVTGTLPPV